MLQILCTGQNGMGTCPLSSTQKKRVSLSCALPPVCYRSTGYTVYTLDVGWPCSSQHRHITLKCLNDTIFQVPEMPHQDQAQNNPKQKKIQQMSTKIKSKLIYEQMLVILYFKQNMVIITNVCA